VRSIFKRWTGVAASINTLRHAFASHLRDTGASAEEKKAVAAAMCHHPLTSEAYVRKPKTNAS
jgi:site-specific recombinase XerD